MVQENAAKYATSGLSGALRQGEILSDVVQFTVFQPSETDNSASFKRTVFELSVIVTPDCDLDWDFKAHQKTESSLKLVPNVVLCRIRSAGDLARRIKQDNESIEKFSKSTDLEEDRSE